MVKYKAFVILKNRKNDALQRLVERDVAGNHVPVFLGRGQPRCLDDAAIVTAKGQIGRHPYLARPQYVNLDFVHNKKRYSFVNKNCFISWAISV